MGGLGQAEGVLAPSKRGSAGGGGLLTPSNSPPALFLCTAHHRATQQSAMPHSYPDKMLTPCMQVSLEALPGGAALPSHPCLWLQMHGPEGLTHSLPFQTTRGGQSEAFDCSAEAVGALTHLTVWLEPLQVCPLIRHWQLS